MEKIRFGVVGLGHRGRHMTQLAIKGFDFTELVAACDIDPLLWSEKQWLQDKPLKESFPDTKFYTDYTRMIEECEIDIMFIETGADVHADFCIQALNKNIDVFSDIPSVATLDEARLLWAAAQRSKARFMTGANANESGSINALVDLYRKGFLGEPYYMEAEYIHAVREPEDLDPIFIHSPWRKSFPPIRYCTHSLGPLLRIMKEELRYTICIGTGQHIDPEALRDDIQSAFFQTESGVTIRLLRNGKCGAFFGPHSFRVFGTKGYYERIGYRGKTPEVVRFQSMEFYGANQMTELPVTSMPNEHINNPKATGHGGVDYALLDHLFKARLDHAPEYPITLRDGLRMTLPGIYAAKSAQLGGQKLTIHYPWEDEFAADIKFIDKA